MAPANRAVQDADKSPIGAVRAWRSFAESQYVTDSSGRRRSWVEYIARSARPDEETLIQPIVFPRFAEELLGFTVGINLAAERPGIEGKPDFSPGDAVTHPFVFETKGTSEQTEMSGHDHQLQNYLTYGRPRIKQVVLTNLVGLQVFSLNDHQQLQCDFQVNLRRLLELPDSAAATTDSANNLARFINRFRHRSLSRAEKLHQIRNAPPWNPNIEVTSGDWITARLDRIVSTLEVDVSEQISSGALMDQSRVSIGERAHILEEVRLLAWRIGLSWDETQVLDLTNFRTAHEGTDPNRALRQYQGHVACYTATRLLLVRIWEDLDLLEPVLYDGGFDTWMKRFEDVVSDVVDSSFLRARTKYRSLFESRNTYSWYRPSENTYIDVIYELANTFLGEIESDVVGGVYERLLERIDRKLLGQYYTPRDIIKLIWDLIDLNRASEQAERENRLPRVLDIATGSGGFLVESLARLWHRFEEQRKAGAELALREWISRVAEGLTGIEFQRFPAYLAELNLLIQLGRALTMERSVGFPPLGILATDTLSLHNPDSLQPPDIHDPTTDLLVDSEDRRIRAREVKDPEASGYWMDVACGNPPYIGQKSGASIMARTRHDYPYWDQYVGEHADYLYWFLLTGISKLSPSGKFGFITTEYWLRAGGARFLRRYIAERCLIDRIILFRNMRLFPDAPGQHSMVITGRRVPSKPNGRPTVSVYNGPAVGIEERRTILEVMRDGRRGQGVNTFRSSVSPNVLGSGSWAEVVLSPQQVRQRSRLKSGAKQLRVAIEEGVIATPDILRREEQAQGLTRRTLLDLGWPDRKPGIFLLSVEEVSSLGPLTSAEKAHLLPVINTRDVLPYAASPPSHATHLLYLPAPSRNPTQSLEEAIAVPFPGNMPTLERHLSRFRPLLESVVRGYRERRPWWSAHRPRTALLSHDGVEGEGWGDYCVTARWGAGQTLIVGLAQRGSVPASGLHCLYSVEGVSAAYICGLLNATSVQDLAETLPPGMIRVEDLSELGLSRIAESENAVAETTRKLADMVNSWRAGLGGSFPKLAPALRDDIALSSVPDDAWMPEIGPETGWGPLFNLGWVGEVSRRGTGRDLVSEVVVRRDVFGGLGVEAVGRRGSTVRMAVVDGGDDVADIVASMFRAAQSTDFQLSDLSNLRGPIDFRVLCRQHETDNLKLYHDVDEYRQLRRAIDDIVDSVM